MNIYSRLQRSFKFRFAILYPFGTAAVIFAIPDDKSIRVGIWFIITGLFIRIWANGYAIKLEKLTTSGPYAFLRHPLYLGTMLLIVGFILTLKIHYIIGILSIIVIAAVYYSTIKKEEQMLEQKFKDAYINYKKKVPAIFPTIFPYREGEKWPFSLARLIKSQEYKLLLWIIILTIVFHLKHEFITEHETMDAKIWGLIITAFILGILDLTGEFIKWQRKSSKRRLAV